MSWQRKHVITHKRLGVFTEEVKRYVIREVIITEWTAYFQFRLHEVARLLNTHLSIIVLTMNSL